MFFTDGADASAGIDPSAAGFASIFSSNASDAPPDTSSDTDSQDGATAADSSAPEGTADAQDLSAEDIVAARFAASLAEDGIELSDSDDETDEAETDETPTDFEKLTRDEIRARLEEFEKLREQQVAADAETQKATVRQSVEAAEAAAVAEVERAFEADVLSVSANHYQAELNKRVAGIVRAAKNQDDPDAYTIQSVISAAQTVFAAQQEYERKKAQEWGPVVDQARLEARKQVPELRQYYAAELAKKYDLPEAAIADIAHPQRAIDTFEHRAQELVQIAQTLGAERKKQTQQKRQDANRRLQAQPVRTSSTGRLPGGKPPEYKGTADEFVKIMRFGSGD